MGQSELILVPVIRSLAPITMPVLHANEAGTHLRICSGGDRLGHINQGAWEMSPDVLKEKHYTVEELAEIWHISYEALRTKLLRLLGF